MKTAEPIRVVLVDNQAVLRQGLRRLLEDEPDIEVVGEAANGLEAVAVTRALAPDMVLMDVVLPRLSGLEATKQIKQSNPATVVLVLSAYDDDRYVLGVLEAGAAGYLLKSATAQEVIHAIRAVHAGEAVLHPAIAGRLLSRAARPPTRAPAHGSELLTEQSRCFAAPPRASVTKRSQASSCSASPPSRRIWSTSSTRWAWDHARKP